MAICQVCDADLPPQRGPRARRYCSRACQAKAYRTRQRQLDARHLTSGDAQSLLTQYDGVPALELADQLALAARQLADALTAGRSVDEGDLDVLTRIPAVLTTRAQQAVPADMGEMATLRQGHAPNAAATSAADTPTTRQPRADTEQSAHFTRPETRATRASRDDSAVATTANSIQPRPQKLAQNKARAVVNAAELVRHPDHRENHRWILRSGDTVLGYVEPTYGGTSRSGRNGWTGRLGGISGRRCTTRDAAALDLAERWIRVVTAVPKRTITGDS
ncbi:hypothetical protein AB0I99_17565 [Streptomyces spongiicola]|uniref:hypothetical protein n=1 Tax=Streptomyces spongiicola TaxID=1690221 RepID=UPI0033D18102